MTEFHSLVGILVLAVNLVAGLGLVLAQRRVGIGRWFMALALAGFLLLAMQVALGTDLWLRGRRPARSPLAEVHVAGPVLASVVYVVALINSRSRGKQWTTAAAALTAAAVALVSYGIGEMD